MKSKTLQHDGEQTFVVVFEQGEEFLSGLQTFAQQHQLRGSHFTAVGAFKDVVLGFFDRERLEYKKIPVNQQAEVLALIGNIADAQGKTKVHAHVVVGLADGSTRGGHVMQAHVWPTLEVIVSEEPSPLRRYSDADTGLALIDMRDSAENVIPLPAAAPRH